MDATATIRRASRYSWRAHSLSMDREGTTCDRSDHRPPPRKTSLTHSSLPNTPPSQARSRLAQNSPQFARNSQSSRPSSAKSPAHNSGARQSLISRYGMATTGIPHSSGSASNNGSSSMTGNGEFPSRNGEIPTRNGEIPNRNGEIHPSRTFSSGESRGIPRPSGVSNLPVRPSATATVKTCTVNIINTCNGGNGNGCNGGSQTTCSGSSRRNVCPREKVLNAEVR